jgi:hypothetical protein
MKKIGLLLVFLVTLGASQSFGLGIGIAYTHGSDWVMRRLPLTARL